MGIQALYPKKKTSWPGKGHKIYPYLLKDLQINRANQVWAADITYIPMARGFLYLGAIIDWYSRKELSWRLSNTMDKLFLHRSAERGAPELRDAWNFQYRPGCSVHFKRIYRYCQRTKHYNQHGWKKDAGWIMSLSNACGEASNMRMSIWKPMTVCLRLKKASTAGSIYIITKSGGINLCGRKRLTPFIFMDYLWKMLINYTPDP